MAQEPAKTKAETTKKGRPTRRRKKAATSTAAEKTLTAGASPATTQVDVGDVARRADGPAVGRQKGAAKPEGADTSAPAKRPKARRKSRKKKAVAAPPAPRNVTPTTVAGQVATTKPTARATTNDTTRDVPMAKEAPTSIDTVDPERAAEPPSSQSEETIPAGEQVRRRSRRGRRGGRRTAAARAKSAQAGQREPADERSARSTAPMAAADDERSTRDNRGRDERHENRGGDRYAPPSPAAQQRSPASSTDAHREIDDDDADVELIDETEETVEVGDVVFPKPDLNERCTREMVINVTGNDECRIAVLHEGRLEELFIERASSLSHVGNIYKGRITNVESSIQAAFVDFGLLKNGFLHVSDVQPQYFPNRTTEVEEVGRKIPRHHRPPIQRCFRRGQEVMVQIIKEGVGTKGPTLTTYLSIPGRYLVMMPGMNRHGVSRKIEDDDERRKMKDVMNELSFPPGMGFILRTAGLGQSKRELQRDLNYLVRLWKGVVDRVKRLPSPAELYRESDLVTRTIRDVYSTDFERLIVDDPVSAKKAKDFFRIAMPRSKPRIEVYTEPEPLFHAFRIEEEIERIHARHVPLKLGGSLVIDSTEALVAIDVNSGRFRVPDDAEETAVQINIQAAEEIARQLRLRDLGGLIVCDFIDMRLDRNKRAVERSLRDALKKHKERARILRMSAFGLIEMTRQRQGPSFERNIYADCPQCRGSGLVKMPESVILDVMRTVQLAAHNRGVHQIRVTVSNEVAYQILNSKRAAIGAIETSTGKNVSIRGDLNFTSDQVECICEDDRGQPIVVAGVDATLTPNSNGPVRKS